MILYHFTIPSVVPSFRLLRGLAYIMYPTNKDIQAFTNIVNGFERFEKKKFYSQKYNISEQKDFLCSKSVYLLSPNWLLYK